MIIYSNQHMNWPYYLVRKSDQTYLVWHTTNTDYIGTTYEMHHNRGDIRDVSSAYPAHDNKFFNRMETEGGWFRETNVFTRLWVGLKLRNKS